MMEPTKCDICGKEAEILIGVKTSDKRRTICKACGNAEVDKAREIIEERDEIKKEKRTTRQFTLGSIVYSVMGKQPPHYLESYMDEARESYLEGAFRSCIFCCADAAEQIIKHELIRESEAPEEKLEWFEKERRGLGKLIGDAEEAEFLRKHIEDFEWLNGVRITIAVHPLYIGVHEGSDDPQTRIWKNRTMIRSVRKTLEFLDGETREAVLESQLSVPAEGKTIKLGDMLTDPSSDHTFFWWRLLEEDVLEELALEAYGRMKKIVEGVYSIKQSSRSKNLAGETNGQ